MTKPAIPLQDLLSVIQPMVDASLPAPVFEPEFVAWLNGAPTPTEVTIASAAAPAPLMSVDGQRREGILEIFAEACSNGTGYDPTVGSRSDVRQWEDANALEQQLPRFTPASAPMKLCSKCGRYGSRCSCPAI